MNNFDFERYMNHTEESLVVNHYRQMVEKCLANILDEYASGKSKDSPEEHEALCQSYHNLLESNLDMNFFQISFLSTLQLRAMLMRMNHALFRLCTKNDEYKQIAYVIQHQIDLDNMENSLKAILRK
jgi:hypothetical protein